MTRISDLIAELQALKDKGQDQVVSEAGTPYAASYLFHQSRLQCIALNKAIHRKNRLAERLRKEIAKLKEEIADLNDPLRKCQHRPHLVEMGSNATPESLVKFLTDVIEEHCRKSGRRLIVRANGLHFAFTDARHVRADFGDAPNPELYEGLESVIHRIVESQSHEKV